jgi:hypothetical protein
MGPVNLDGFPKDRYFLCKMCVGHGFPFPDGNPVVLRIDRRERDLEADQDGKGAGQNKRRQATGQGREEKAGPDHDGRRESDSRSPADKGAKAGKEVCFHTFKRVIQGTDPPRFFTL